MWATRLAHNASWQMELTRQQDTLSFSGGIADCEFGLWSVTVQPGESYKAPSAHISTVSGDVSDACQSLTALDNIACENYNEGGLPICYNEFCTSWGKPTQEKIISYAEKFGYKGCCQLQNPYLISNDNKVSDFNKRVGRNFRFRPCIK